MAMTPQELHDAAIWWSDALQEAGAGFRARLDAAAKVPVPDDQARPPMPREFDRHFRQLALPKLEFWARFLGKRCAITRLTGSPWGAEFGWGFDYCYAILMREALALGAIWLRDLPGLQEYLLDRLTEEVVKHSQGELHE